MKTVELRALPALLILCYLTGPAAIATTQLQVGTNLFVPFDKTSRAGEKVFLDASPEGGTPVHAMQRALGYREVEYKARVFASLPFQPVTPATNGSNTVYDYSAQAGVSNLVGYLAAKDVPILIGPDGLPYIADGHHTTAGYLSPSSPVREIVPGQKRILLGHIVTNSYDPTAGPKPPDDAWWNARRDENNAYFYGTNGNQLAVPAPGESSFLAPVAPSAQAMPTTPSAISVAGLIPMGSDPYRSLAWGMADGIVHSATDSSGHKLVGFNKRADNGEEIHFVEFCWADYMRGRIWWDDAKSGAPYPSTNRDANVIGAPLGFFAAVANGIALARSESYRDQFGRSLRDYANAAIYPANTATWAAESLAHAEPGISNVFNLYWFDDSRIVGRIAPSSNAVNILHINTTGKVALSNQLENIATLQVNSAGRLKTSWRDAAMRNTELRYPEGNGTVTLVEGATYEGNIVLGHGTLELQGRVTGRLLATGGTIRGGGAVDGPVILGRDSILDLDNPAVLFHATGGAGLNGQVKVTLVKDGLPRPEGRFASERDLYFRGTLSVALAGEKPALGDSHKIFQAAGYKGKFSRYDLPALEPGLAWDTSQLAVDGSLRIIKDKKSR
ncbi:MAG TPA: ParB/Srx family N-terminal domain-containing protein [Candidatus Limnocylindria bacterium]|nr:ParB/Srx family N-terminal domain-containing protein [Candidatus Limnocylindria bacterium]